MAVSFVDDAETPVTLGPELGRGGEGSVFEISGTDLVAKIYHQPADQTKAEKLAAMVRLRSDALSSFAAWPERRVLDRSRKQTWGIILPRVAGHREIHRLYSPAHRKIEFPAADWSFLIHVARNCAAAFESIHAAGHVVGDVNQGGVLVARQGTIKLIDCDSFQINDGNRLFTCDVGVPHFTAPELQGKAFRGLQRTTAHDEFGLAVLIFHLLFMGRHPFAGRYHGKGDPPPIELSIQQGRFAYGAAAAAAQMSPPPHALRLSHVTPIVADLFERAFRHSSGQLTRPTAKDWVNALEGLKASLASCSRFHGHKFVNGRAQSCPWCDIEKGGGPDLFISITVGAKLNSSFDLALIWGRIEAVHAPRAVALPASSVGAAPPVPLAPSLKAWGVATIAAAGGVFLTLGGLIAGEPAAGIVAVAFAVIWMLLRSTSPYAAIRKERSSALSTAELELNRVELEWRSTTESATKSFSALKTELTKKRSEYQALPQASQKEEQELVSQKREHQLRAYLRAHFIEDASIKGIGPGRISMLRSFGIETALDVTPERVSAVDGFGPARTASVVAWRRVVEAAFRFDPAGGVDPAERAALIQRHSQRRAAVESVLMKGPMQLQQVISQAEHGWQMYHHRYVAAAREREAAVSAAAALPFPPWLA